MENAVRRICFVPSMTWNKLPGLTEYCSKSDVHNVRAVAAFFPTANSNNRLINDRLPCAWQHNWGLCPSDVSLRDDVKMPNVHRYHRCWLWPRHEFGRETNELQCFDETHGRLLAILKVGVKGFDLFAEELHWTMEEYCRYLPFFKRIISGSTVQWYVVMWWIQPCMYMYKFSCYNKGQVWNNDKLITYIAISMHRK